MQYWRSTTSWHSEKWHDGIPSFQGWWRRLRSTSSSSQAQKLCDSILVKVVPEDEGAEAGSGTGRGEVDAVAKTAFNSKNQATWD